MQITNNITNLYIGKQVKNQEKDTNLGNTAFKADNYSSFPKAENIKAKFMPKVSFKGQDNVIKQQQKKDIDFYLQYKDFDEVKAKKEAEDMADARIKALYDERKDNFFLWNRRVKDSEKMQIRENERQRFCNRKNNYQKIKNNLGYYTSLISSYDIDIYNAVKNKLKQKDAALDSSIAGYKKQKKNLREILIHPMQRENTLGTEEQIPPAILLYGPTGCGKTTFAKSLAKEANVNIIDFSDPTKPKVTPQKFAPLLSQALQQAKERYKKIDEENKWTKNSIKFSDMSIDEKAQKIIDSENPRTIIIIDEADKYFNIQEEGNSPEIANNNKTILKGILDHCSESPTADNHNELAAGATIIFTSNKPSIIDSEISKRTGKCTSLPILPPDIEDSKEILKHYLNQGNVTISKEMKNSENPKRNLLKPIDIKNFSIDLFDDSLESSPEKGILGCSGIENATKKSINNYVRNPNDFLDCNLCENLENHNFRIPQKKVDEYLREVEIMNKNMKELDNKEELSLLKELKELDMLEPGQQNRIDLLNRHYGNETKDGNIYMARPESYDKEEDY